MNSQITSAAATYNKLPFGGRSARPTMRCFTRSATCVQMGWFGGAAYTWCSESIEASTTLSQNNVREIGSALRELQDQRHLADYEPPGHKFARAKALALVQRSRDAVDLVQQLDAESRTQLAIFLLVSKRPI